MMRIFFYNEVWINTLFFEGVMGSPLHNRIYLGGRISPAQTKRLWIFAGLFAVVGIVALALVWLK
jgi:hypothetical protein